MRANPIGTFGGTMILFAKRHEQQQEVLEKCKNTAFGCKIAGTAISYGFDEKFACFWLDDKSTAVYCLVDNVMILDGTPSDTEEAMEFLKMTGASQLICSSANADALKLSCTQSGEVLSKTACGGNFTQNEVNIREVFSLLEDSGMELDFEPFYLDLSHRLRHGTGAATTAQWGDDFAGCALISSITDNAAILSAVAVKEKYRRHGMGTRLITTVESVLQSGKIYLFKEFNENDEFYKSLGYTKEDTWACVKL